PPPPDPATAFRDELVAVARPQFGAIAQALVAKAIEDRDTGALRYIADTLLQIADSGTSPLERSLRLLAAARVETARARWPTDAEAPSTQVDGEMGLAPAQADDGTGTPPPSRRDSAHPPPAPRPRVRALHSGARDRHTAPP